MKIDRELVPFVLVLGVVGIALLPISFYRTLAPLADGSLVSARFESTFLTVEIASTETSRERGLGGRNEIKDDFGMLFVFPHADYWSFWMKDTLVPLDMFWLDDLGRVIYIKEGVLPSTYPESFSPSTPASYVLETTAGFGALHGVTNGTQLHLKNGGGVLQ